VGGSGKKKGEKEKEKRRAPSSSFLIFPTGGEKVREDGKR